MTVSRGGDAVIAAGPTELRRYLPISLIATAIVVGVPMWFVFSYSERLGFLATVLSVLVSFALAHVGAVVWKRSTASRDVVFNDLMLWGFVRRFVTQRRMIRRVERLGFSVSNDPDEMTLEERTDLLKKLAEGLETGDPYTHGHSQRVARHAYMVAKQMKLSRRQTEKIRLAGVIHDVGKLRIPREIITKPGKLTDAEFDVIKRHTVDGAAMVEVLRDPEVTDMVRHHHERLDGSGYPDRLSGDEISIGARVLAVADTFDAASSLRPYRAAQKHKIALDILQEEARTGRLDPSVVEAFIRYYSGRKSLRWWAFLSSGPAHLQDLPFGFIQRVGATGLANAAVVGVTAVALAPGSPLHGRPVDHDDVRKKHAIARQSEEAEVVSGSTTESGAASSSAKAAPSTSKANRDARSRSKDRNGKPGSKSKGGGKPASSRGSGKPPKEPKDKPSQSAKGNGPKDENGPAEEETIAGAVDTTTGGVTGAVKNGTDEHSKPSASEETSTAPVTDEVGSASGNSGTSSKDKK